MYYCNIQLTILLLLALSDISQTGFVFFFEKYCVVKRKNSFSFFINV